MQSVIGCLTRTTLETVSAGWNWNQNPELSTCKVFEKMVARDGIEPPTPAFSGLRSTD